MRRITVMRMITATRNTAMTEEDHCYENEFRRITTAVRRITATWEIRDFCY